MQQWTSRILCCIGEENVLWCRVMLYFSHTVCHMVLYLYCKMTYIFLHLSLELFALYIVPKYTLTQVLSWQKRMPFHLWKSRNCKVKHIFIYFLNSIPNTHTGWTHSINHGSNWIFSALYVHKPAFVGIQMYTSSNKPHYSDILHCCGNKH